MVIRYIYTYIICKSICKSLWIKASAIWINAISTILSVFCFIYLSTCPIFNVPINFTFFISVYLFALFSVSSTIYTFAILPWQFLFIYLYLFIYSNNIIITIIITVINDQLRQINIKNNNKLKSIIIIIGRGKLERNIRKNNPTPPTVLQYNLHLCFNAN